MSSTQTLVKSSLNSYRIGDTDQRPWGEYVVINVGKETSGEEYCEKEITVNPGQILSLQSHELRRERWTVLKGTLTVVSDDTRIDLTEGESIDIPLGAIHCMSNRFDKPCVVHERQMGTCSEEDIIRYADAYGRAPGETTPQIAKSVKHFNDILAEIQKKSA
ncbi:MAG: phosphomannose isomerase type II C-terminal cupin domain [Alphaproteobacteria bacterium]|nr:phosphomannose isomerase type II C-terminal cupin domain [Alphaproteobacteria bacterium]